MKNEKEKNKIIKVGNKLKNKLIREKNLRKKKLIKNSEHEGNRFLFEMPKQILNWVNNRIPLSLENESLFEDLSSFSDSLTQPDTVEWWIPNLKICIF